MRGFNMLLLGLLVSVSAQAGSVLKIDAKDSAGKTHAEGGLLRAGRHAARR